MTRSRPAIWPWVLASLGLLMVVGFIGLSLIAAAVGGASLTGPSVGLVELSGMITDQGASGLLGGRSGGARAFMEDLERAGKDPNVKAVVIRINSPGGAAAASQEMYAAVLRLRQKKPVICSMGDVAASGGYYVAAACNKIYANPSTVTGSIGVISQFLNYQSLFRKVGLDETTIKSGKFKDAGNPTRPLRPDERQYFQAMVMSIYGQFVDDIAAGRKDATKGKLTREKVRRLADGRVYTGKQAKANQLVDEVGGLRDASRAAAKAGGLDVEDFKIKEIGRGGGLLSSMMGASSRSSSGSLLEETGASLGRSFGAAAAEGFAAQMKAESQNGALPELR